jgi:hypothetical protein
LTVVHRSLTIHFVTAFNSTPFRSIVVTLSGTVEKIIPPITPNQPEKAPISVEGAEHLYKEIRVENPLQDESGNEVALKKGAKVDVTIEADPEATEHKK